MGAMDDQSFEFLLNNFARLTNIISEECSTFALFKSVFRLPLLFIAFKGQLKRFHKLISNDRLWPSEHGFEVIFEKSLFVFEISAFKVRNKRGIHSRFHSFSENNNRETFVCDVTSDQSSRAQ